MLFIDLGAQQGSRLLQLLHALFQGRTLRHRGGGLRLSGRGDGGSRRSGGGHLRWNAGRAIGADGNRAFQQAARGLQFLAEFLHLSARTHIFGAHLIHGHAQLADLLLQVAHGADHVVVGRRGRCGLLRPAGCRENEENGGCERSPVYGRGLKPFHTLLLRRSRTEWRPANGVAGLQVRMGG